MKTRLTQIAPPVSFRFGAFPQTPEKRLPSGHWLYGNKKKITFCYSLMASMQWPHEAAPGDRGSDLCKVKVHDDRDAKGRSAMVRAGFLGGNFHKRDTMPKFLRAKSIAWDVPSNMTVPNEPLQIGLWHESSINNMP